MVSTRTAEKREEKRERERREKRRWKLKEKERERMMNSRYQLGLLVNPQINSEHLMMYVHYLVSSSYFITSFIGKRPLLGVDGVMMQPIVSR